MNHTVRPAEAFTGDHLEVNALVSVLRVDQVRELNGIELILCEKV